MNKYWKAWGSLIGAAVGVAAVYGLVPDGTDKQIADALNILGPVLGGVIGTYLAPKNAG